MQTQVFLHFCASCFPYGVIVKVGAPLIMCRVLPRFPGMSKSQHKANELKTNINPSFKSSIKMLLYIFFLGNFGKEGEKESGGGLEGSLRLSGQEHPLHLHLSYLLNFKEF